MEYSDAVVATTISKVAQIEKDQLTHTHYIHIDIYIYICVYINIKNVYIYKKNYPRDFTLWIFLRNCYSTVVGCVFFVGEFYPYGQCLAGQS